jgi:cyclohexanone monooxygenase
MTGPLLRIDVQGRNGLSLRDYWSNGPQALLGMQVAGFPNLFLVSGPFSPSVLAVMTIGIEQQVDWIMECLAHMRETGLGAVEATPAAQSEWMEHTQGLVRDTLRVKYDSWYLGANIPGKPRVFMVYTGGLGAYKQRCDATASDGYRGFEFSALAEGTAYDGNSDASHRVSAAP